MQAILTRYLAPTDTRGSRITATCEAGSIYVPYDHELDVEGNHKAAAAELCRRLRWKGTLATGCLHTGDYANVVIEE